jgi:hypothetical protein
VRAAAIFAQANDKGGCDRSLFFNQFRSAAAPLIMAIRILRGL